MNQNFHQGSSIETNMDEEEENFMEMCKQVSKKVFWLTSLSLALRERYEKW